MFDHRVRLPLAFLLAMSAADGGSKVRALVKQDETVLRRGSLSELLSVEPGSDGLSITDREGAAAGEHTAQWFNWLNCVSGFWRRC